MTTQTQGHRCVHWAWEWPLEGFSLNGLWGGSIFILMLMGGEGLQSGVEGSLSFLVLPLSSPHPQCFQLSLPDAPGGQWGK